MNKNILITGYPGWLTNRLVQIFNDKDISYTTMNYPRYDVRNYNDCLKITKDISYVVHCAGVIHPKKVKDFYTINTKGTENIVRASMENNILKFIYISSNSACGYSKYNLVMNEFLYGSPYMAYGNSKYLAEKIIFSYLSFSKIKYIILRPCWFYGINPPDRLITMFNMIKKGKPMIFGNGNNLRSMTYIDNLIDAIILSLEYDRGHGDYWISDNKPYTTNEIYHTIAELLNVDIKPRYIPNIASKICRLGDKYLQKIGKYNSYIHVAGEMNLDIACDISKAKRELGYNPKIELREGMKRTLESIKWI